MSDKEKVDPPLGFNVQPLENGEFALGVTGASSWFVSGFVSPQAIHDWVLEYLTTLSENMARVNIEAAERQAAHNRAQELKRMEILAQYPTGETKH